MSRFELGGQGDPIPLIALPDPNLDDDLPPQVFVLQDGQPFVKTDWVGLGYTHYEVWCVGGAGGRGGGESNSIVWKASRVRPVMNAAEWENYLQLMVYYSSQLNPPHGPYGGTEAGVRAYYEVQFPQHNPWYVTTWLEPYLIDVAVPGGAGGGGGMQVASGLLADLGDATPVQVGSAGADAPAGHTQLNGAWTPVPYEVWGGGTALQQWATEWMNEWPNPHETIPIAVAGGDGGASTFGGDICQASGGKGGKPYMVWNGSAFVRDGDGGDGGVGGQTTAGGGAAGAASDGVNGSDGTWDGTIGEGGGGGHAGKPAVPDNPGVFGDQSVPAIPPTDGGRGAFSYSDTSVFGDRQTKTFGSYRQLEFDYYTGAVSVDRIVATADIMTPGGGGGARALRTMNKGSRAVSFDPNGIVVIRLTAVVP